MAGATKAEIAGIVTLQIGAKLQSTTGEDVDTTVSTDAKFPVELIDKCVLDAFSSVASTVARSPLQADSWLFCIQESDLGNGDGQYHINTAIITGPIVRVDVSYDSSAFTYKYAEPDSATAIQDYRTLRNATPSRRLTKLYSYCVDGETIFYPGTRIRVTFVPGDIGESGSDITTIPRKYAFWVAAEALAFLFGRDGGKLEAGNFYAQLAHQYRQLALAGATEMPNLLPYAGS